MDGSMDAAIWRDVGAIDDIPRLGARRVERPGGAIAVFRTADDRTGRWDCPPKNV